MEGNNNQGNELKKVSSFWSEYRWERYFFSAFSSIFLAVAFFSNGGFDLADVRDGAFIKVLLFTILLYLAEIRYLLIQNSGAK